MRYVSLAVMLLLLPPILRAQQEPVAIAVGSPMVQPARITRSVERFEMVALKDGGPEAAMGTYTTKVEQVGPVLLITQETKIEQGIIVDSAWVDPVTFVPSRQVSYGPAGPSELRFEGVRIRGNRTLPGGVATTTDETLTAAPFSASLAPMMVRALPLAENFSAAYPVFRDPGGVSTATVRVIGREQVPGSTRMAWKVTLAVGPQTATLWVDEGREWRTEATLVTGALLVMRPLPAGK